VRRFAPGRVVLHAEGCASPRLAAPVVGRQRGLSKLSPGGGDPSPSASEACWREVEPPHEKLSPEKLGRTGPPDNLGGDYFGGTGPLTTPPPPPD